MSLSNITRRVSRTLLTQCRNSAPLQGRHESNLFQNSSSRLCSSRGICEKVLPGQVSLLHHSALKSSGFQWFGFSSSAASQPSEKETVQGTNEQETKETNDEAAAMAATDTPQAESNEKPKSGPNINTSGTPDRKRAAKRVAFSDSDSDSDLEFDHLSRDDLVKLVSEKEQLLAAKQEELEQVKNTALRSLAEMENTKERTRREAENGKKFAIQNFAKSLLDVADNLGRASSAAQESFSKVDVSKDASGASKQLKTLLEGVEMTEKQLNEVFRKFGLEKYDPLDEEFDPNRHNAVFQVPDSSKPADRVAVVLKAGYILHDRVIRPAEVGVTVAANKEEGEKSNEDQPS